jgi:oligosaccharide repeat unit polymerase
MLEVLLIITLAGLILSCSRRMGIGNPFQLYFMIWFLIFFLYYVSRERYISVSSEFIVFLIAVKIFSFFLLFFTYNMRKGASKLSTPVSISKSQDRLIALAQIVVTVALPFVFFRSITFTGGGDIFTISGYGQLRIAMTYLGESFGLLNYFFIPSYVVSSLITFSYRQGSANISRLLVSILVSLSYVYLSTGRTHLLLFVCLMVTPLVLSETFRLKGILFAALVFSGIFIFMAGMADKGISKDVGIFENLESFHEYMSGYTVLPLLAFSRLVESGLDIDWGKNIFRFFFAVSYALGFSGTNPEPLVRDYIFYDAPTNVYTVYEVYFRDFFYFGIFIPPALLIAHYWLYRKAIRFSGVWVFYYSASVYPLLLQFFQDQYFSLLSIWIQVAFWYWLFLGLRKSKSLISTLGLR